MSAFLKKLGRWPAWWPLGLAVVLVVAVRIHLRDMPLERDEGEYAYAGQLILQGVPPYKEVYNMKLPGTYAAYAAIMAVFGQTPAGIHLGLLLVNVACIFLVYLVGRRILDDTGAVAAAVSFAFMSLSPSILGLAGHATHFVILFALAGIWLLLKAVVNHEIREKHERGREIERPTFNFQLSTFNFQPLLFLSGLCFGVAFLMKQQGVFFGLFGGFFLVWLHLSERFVAKEADRQRRRTSVPRPIRRGATTAAATTNQPQRRLTAIQRSKREAEDGGRRAEDGGQKTGEGSGVTHRREEAEAQSGVEANHEILEIHETLGPQIQQQGNEAKEARRTEGGEDVTQRGEEAKTQGDERIEAGGRKTEVSGRRFQFSVFSFSAFCIGCVLPYVLTCLVLWGCGVFPQFWFWTVTYAAKYASAIPLENAADMLKAGLRSAVGPGLLFWLLPWAGALLMWWDEGLDDKLTSGNAEMLKKRLPKDTAPHLSTFPPSHLPTLPRRLFLVGLLAFSFGSVSIGLYYREHYFITLLAALALLTGVAVSRAIRLIRKDKSIELFLALPVLLGALIAPIAATVGYGSAWFGSINSASRDIYGTELFLEAAKVSEFIRTNTPTNSRIAIVGSEPEIFFASQRRSAAGHVYVYPLMEEHDYAGEMQSAFIREVEAGHPDYVIYVDDPWSWLPRPKSHQALSEWWQGYSATNLDMVAHFDYQRDLPRGGSDADVQGVRKQSGTSSSLTVYTRRKN